MFSRFKRKQKEESPPQSVREANLLAENFKLRETNRRISKEKEELELKFQKKEFIDVLLGDPAPKDGEKRKLYVSQVAGVHKEILEPKFKQMISAAHALLEETNNAREFDQSLKGGIYMLWEIIRWGDLMVSEQIANQSNQNPGLPDEEK